MKKYFFLTALILCKVAALNAQNEFITAWKYSGATMLFPAIGNGFNVQWEEEGFPAHNGTLTNVTPNSSNAFTITFGTPLNPVPPNTVYIVKISGPLQAWPDAKSGDVVNTPFEIRQWGNIAWTTMEGAFANCRQMTLTATDAPNLSAVTSMKRMFYDCGTFTGHPSMNTWQTGTVTDMSYLFQHAANFNAPIGNWNTENVTTMASMFEAFLGSGFNQNIGSWNTGKVADISRMFINNKVFNQNLSLWNVERVTTMESMFSGAIAFNSPFSNGNTANVTNMAFMFYGASAFNQPVGNWNTGSLTNAWQMFEGATSFNQPIGNWDVSKLKHAYRMLADARSFNQKLGNWNLAAASTVNDMLRGNAMDCLNYSATSVILGLL